MWSLLSVYCRARQSSKGLPLSHQNSVQGNLRFSLFSPKGLRENTVSTSMVALEVHFLQGLIVNKKVEHCINLKSLVN